MENIITISDKASEQIKEIMEKEGKLDSGLRIGVNGVSCSGPNYVLGFQDNAMTDDKVLDIKGIKIFIDELSFPYLEGVELDFIDQSGQKGFIFRNPSLTGGCSCDGSSCSC